MYLFINFPYRYKYGKQKFWDCLSNITQVTGISKLSSRRHDVHDHTHPNDTLLVGDVVAVPNLLMQSGGAVGLGSCYHGNQNVVAIQKKHGNRQLVQAAATFLARG